jgi:hypothetical protein
MTIIVFHNISFGENNEWKEAWTSTPKNKIARPKHVC